MRKKLSVLLLFLLSIQTIYAQGGQRDSRQAIRENMLQKLEAAKWGFIIYRLNLSEERSNQLLPVFKAYEGEKRAIIAASAQQKARNNPNDMNDQEAETIMNAKLENAQKLLDLKEKYKPKFLSVLSPKELWALQNAEQDFAMKVMMERQKRRAERNK
jgi:hypothetical protein